MRGIRVQDQEKAVRIGLKVLELHQQGLSLEDIAARVGRSVSRVKATISGTNKSLNKHLVENGLPVPTRRKKEKIPDLYDDMKRDVMRMRFKDVAEKYGVSISSVQNLFSGIRPRICLNVGKQHRNESMARDYIGGMSFQELMGKYNMSWHATISAIHKSMGERSTLSEELRAELVRYHEEAKAKRQRAGKVGLRSLSEEMVKKIRIMYAMGVGVYDIARSLSLVPETVRGVTSMRYYRDIQVSESDILQETGLRLAAE